ncbi:unnamed protein product [Soboliphyme baturini]|uniref:Fibronectin type-III domain-containing protein n=1 Tax=Soboliphyme baturini TaxID=241478 RepID=A0A183IFS1_9BILA|nr:unnamed protein product [Soboliphyme baturini]
MGSVCRDGGGEVRRVTGIAERPQLTDSFSCFLVGDLLVKNVSVQAMSDSSAFVSWEPSTDHRVHGYKVSIDWFDALSFSPLNRLLSLRMYFSFLSFTWKFFFCTSSHRCVNYSFRFTLVNFHLL